MKQNMQQDSLQALRSFMIYVKKDKQDFSFEMVVIDLGFVMRKHDKERKICHENIICFNELLLSSDPNHLLKTSYQLLCDRLANYQKLVR